MSEISIISGLVRDVRRKLAAPHGKGWQWKTNVSPVNESFQAMQGLTAMGNDKTIEMDPNRMAFDNSGRRLKDAKAVYTRRKK